MAGRTKGPGGTGRTDPARTNKEVMVSNRLIPSISGRGRRAGVGLIAALFMLAPGVPRTRAQDTPPAELRSPVRKTEAIVLGRVISLKEIEKEYEALRAEFPEEKENLLFWSARRRLGIRALLAETGKRFFPEVTDAQIVQYWAAQLEKEEKTIAAELETFRDDFFISRYLDSRMGLVQSPPGLAPDYADFVRVTPEEVRRAYARTYRPGEKRPAVIRVAQFLFPDSAYAGRDPQNEAVERLRAALADRPGGTETEAFLRDRAKRLGGVRFRMVEVPEEGESPLLEPLLRFARTAAPGTVSSPLRAGSQVVVQYVVERKETKIPPFDAVQDKITRDLQRKKRLIAQEAIVRELIMHADYYPSDLFFPSRGAGEAGPAAKGKGEGSLRKERP